MRSISLRLSVLVAILASGISSSVWAFGNRGTVETVYLAEPLTATAVIPTVYETTSWVLPTSYEPTAWVTPTSYFLPASATYSTVYPTSYATSSVVVSPTVYAFETTYYRRGLLGRRWRVDRPVITAYPAGYLATAYVLPATSRTLAYAPTVLRDPGLMQTAYLNSADCPCPLTSLPAAPATKAPAASSGTRSVQSQPADELPVKSSTVPPPPGEIDPPAARSGVAENPQSSGDMALPASKTGNAQQSLENPGGLPDNTPPIPLPAVRTPSKPADAATKTPKTATPKEAPKPVVPANLDEKLAPPTAPPGDLLPAPDTTRRDSLRPTYPATPRAMLTASTRAVLYGMVESGTAGEPEEGVRVTLASPSNPDGDRVTLTNAFGKFAVRLPDGQWDVLVTMPSGRQRIVDGPLGRITVRNGRITDQEGHAVPSVIITR